MCKLSIIAAGLLLLAGCAANSGSESAKGPTATKPAATVPTATVPVANSPAPSPPAPGAPAVAAPVLTATPSGFLNDYSKLKPSPHHRNTLYEQSPKLMTYTKFVVDPVVMLAKRINLGRLGDGLDLDTSAMLAKLARDEVINSLKVNNQIVDQPGPGVARIRSAITGVGALAATGSLPSRFNAASVEVEIVDSVSGERLAAAIEADQVNPADLYDSGASESMSGRYDLIRMVFTHWSSRMNLFFERARRGE